jgi:putative PEP-CTERM system histidine kinase
MLSTLALILFPLFAAGAALGVAAMLLRYDWRAPANRLLALSLALMAAHLAALGLAGAAPGLGLRLHFARAALALWAALPPAWLAFSLAFARAGVSRRWQLLLLALGAGSLLGALVLAAGAGLRPMRLWSGGELLWGVDDWGKALLSLTLLGASLVLLQVENLYRHAARIARWQIKFLVVGVFLAFACQIVAASHALLFGHIHPKYPALAAAAVLAGATLIAFSLIRHRLLHVDVFVSRYVVYRSVTLALIGGYVLSLGAVAEVFKRLDIQLDAVTGMVLASLGAGALALVLLSEEVRRRIQCQLHTHFFKHKYDYRLEWMEFTRRLSHAGAASQIAAQTLGRLLEVMWVRQAAMYTLDGAGELVLVHQVEYPGLPERLRLAPAGLEALRELSGQAAGRDGVLRLQALLPAGTPVGLVAPMVALDTLVGLLLVGPESSGKPFGVDDQDLLAAVATQASAMLLNARLAQETSEGRELAVMARLSAFIAHDLKNTVAGLSLLTENARQHLHKPEFQRDALETLVQLTARMKKLLAVLAAPSGRPGGRPERLAVAAVLETWLREQARALPPRIRLETALAWAGEVQADPEQLRSILQNLLLNAVEAIPQEGTIRVETAAAGDEALVIVSDTGRGMSAEFMRDRLFRPFQTTKPRGLGIGLYQCRHLLSAMGGSLTVESQEGRGTRMLVRLPAVSAEGAAMHDLQSDGALSPPSGPFTAMAPASALGRLT